MSMRGAALAGGWVVALGVATAVSWAGVRMVGDEVAPTGAGALSQAEVERRIHASSPGPGSSGLPSTSAPSSASLPPSASTPPPPPPSVSAPPPVQTSVVARGGTVVLRCTGSTITARFSPASGYSGQEERSDGGRVEVEFKSAVGRSKVEAVCRAGTPVVKVEESGSGEDDD